MNMNERNILTAGFLAAQVALAGPLTLQEMTGGHIAFDTNSAALILIDYQREYTSGRLPLFQVDSAIAEGKRVLEFARTKKIPVVHVLHQGAHNSLFDLGGNGGKVIAEVAPLEGETIIYKSFPSSFAETELENILKS